MKIIYDNAIFNFQKYGGISRYFSEIIRRIGEYNDAQVYIFKRLNWKLSRFNNLWLNFKLTKGRFDIYHPTYYSATIKKRGYIKTIVTVYDMIHELNLSGANNSKSGIPIKKDSILNADHLICISNNTKKDLQKIYNIGDERISVIYLGAPPKREPAGNKNSFPSRPYILYVGKRDLPYKNFKTLLKAFYELKMEKDFELICFGGTEFSRREISEFKKLRIENAVKYVTGPDELLRAYYENARVFIYPSLYEGFGLPVLEAMAFGCPVIASNAASIPEITDNAALLFSPENIEELCTCIRSIINDNKMRSDYIEKGKIRSKYFSWEKTTLETFNIYQKVLD